MAFEHVHALPFEVMGRHVEEQLPASVRMLKFALRLRSAIVHVQSQGQDVCVHLDGKLAGERVVGMARRDDEVIADAQNAPSHEVVDDFSILLDSSQKPVPGPGVCRSACLDGCRSREAEAVRIREHICMFGHQPGAMHPRGSPIHHSPLSTSSPLTANASTPSGPGPPAGAPASAHATMVSLTSGTCVHLAPGPGETAA